MATEHPVALSAPETPALPRDFWSALVGDGRPLIMLTALCLALSGGFAIFLSMSGQFLPHDVAFLGMQPEALCREYGCRIVHFMFHDRMAFGGVLLAISVLYAWLALFPLSQGESWAWWTLALTGLTGFGSFLAYLSYGYLDTWHGIATLFLLPIFVSGLWMTRPRRIGADRRGVEWLGTLLLPGRIPSRWLSRAGLGRLSLLLVGFGNFAAGATVLTVGMTRVFVPQDLKFIGASVEQLQAINARLIPLIAHDRAGFGGGLLTTGLLILCIVWKAVPERHVWQALLVGGLFGFGCAIGVHYPIGYRDFTHVGPAWAGAALFVVGMWLAADDYGVGRRPQPNLPS